VKVVIRHATVFDPANGVDGEIRDIYIRDGIVTSHFRDADEEIEASGLWAFPGGVEAGTCLTTMGMEFYRWKGEIPSLLEVSRAFARLGYTHLHEAMMFPTTALWTHYALSKIPYQDTSASLCLTLREFGGLIGSNIPPDWTVSFLKSCARRFRALNIRLPEASVHYKESNLARYNIPARRVLDYLSEFTFDIPFVVELTPRLLDEDLPRIPNLFYGHVGRAVDGEYAFKQISSRFSEEGMTGDIGLAPPDPHTQIKTEMMMGEGEEVAVYVGLHAPLRFVRVSKPSQPTYVVRLLTHPEFRTRLAFSSLSLGGDAGRCYPSLFKEIFAADESYTVRDFVMQTRLLPARQLGLKEKGHLGEGAVGDVALYDPGEKGDRLPGEIVGQCHTLLKGGCVVLREGRFTGKVPPSRYTYFRDHTLSERDYSMFAGYFRHYPRLEHLDVPDTLGEWHPLPAEGS